MSKGLRHDPLADIELIRQNLKDRYAEGYPILKELIQNAEDSYATKVEFAWTHGIPEARHLLLRKKAYALEACRENIPREFHSSRIAIHLGSSKMYKDLQRNTDSME